MPVLLDTSVLIAGREGPPDDAAISVVSLTELHLGVLVAPDDGVPLLTFNFKDFQILEDLVEVREPPG